MKEEATIRIPLNKREFEMLFKWYDKGFTYIEEDKPLLDKLKQYYERIPQDG